MEAIKTNKRILVLDKGSRLLDAVDDLLATGDWDLRITFNAKAIFDIAKDYKPDLIVLDYLLLDNACAVICRDFQDDPELKLVPVFIVTTCKTRKIKAEAYKCDAIFVKPLDLELLVSRVEYLMAS